LLVLFVVALCMQKHLCFCQQVRPASASASAVFSVCVELFCCLAEHPSANSLLLGLLGPLPSSPNQRDFPRCCYYCCYYYCCCCCCCCCCWWLQIFCCLKICCWILTKQAAVVGCAAGCAVGVDGDCCACLPCVDFVGMIAYLFL